MTGGNTRGRGTDMAQTGSDPVESLIPADNRIARFRFVFIAGLHRSGTTPLFKALRGHPMVSGFRIPGGAEREHEGQLHQTVYPRGVEMGGPGYFCLDRASWLDENSALATLPNAERLFLEWGRLWDLSRPYLLEKSPPNLVRMRFLQRLFPNTYFVVIVRHPIAVSLATMKWVGWPRHVVAPSPDVEHDTAYAVRPATKADIDSFHKSRRLFMESMLYTLLEHWKTGYARYLEDALLLKRHVLVRYEDLVDDPEGTVNRLYDFLDLPPIESSLNFDISSHNDRYFNEWLSMPADVVTPEYRRFLRDRFEDAASRFGYSLSETDNVSDSMEKIGSQAGGADRIG